MKFLDRLRPRTASPTAAELRAALAEAEQQAAAMHIEAADMEKRRGDVLADDGADEFARLDASIAEKRRQIEGAMTLAATLRGRLDRAANHEMATALTAEADAFEAESAALAAALMGEYPKLAARIADLALRERRLALTHEGLARRLLAAREAGAELPRDFSLRMPVASLGGAHLFGDFLRLPAGDNRTAPIWPPAALNVSALLAPHVVRHLPEGAK
jgi:hypothetical protein